MSQHNTKTPAMVLQEFTERNGYSPPEYILSTARISRTGVYIFDYHVRVLNVDGCGFGYSKQVAKHNAAKHALSILADRGLYDPNSNPAHVEFNALSHRNESTNPFKPPVNFIGSLRDMCYKHKLACPLFTMISDMGPPHCREFTYKCNVASTVTQATANTKKQAKQLAARDMLDKISGFIAQCEAKAKRDAELANTVDVIPNKVMEVKNFLITITKIMEEKGLTFQDFQEQFANRSRDGLDYIFDSLGVKFKIELMQENPAIAYAIFGLETPVTIVSLGNCRENAELNLVYDIFKILTTYLNITDVEV